MFKTISIKNISKSYNDKVRSHNHDVAIKNYLKVFGFFDCRNIGSKKEEYELCFAIKIENNDGEKEKIVFAYKTKDKEYYARFNYSPDIITGGSGKDTNPNNAIRLFCEKYGQYLFDGYDIVELVEYDTENILNYNPEIKNIKRR